jgi:hypothetical protein
VDRKEAEVTLLRYRYYRLHGHGVAGAWMLAYPWTWFGLCVIVGASTIFW